MNGFDEYDRQRITNLLHAFTAAELITAAHWFSVGGPAMSKWLAAARLVRAGKDVSDVRQILEVSR